MHRIGVTSIQNVPRVVRGISCGCNNEDVRFASGIRKEWRRTRLNPCHGKMKRASFVENFWIETAIACRIFFLDSLLNFRGIDVEKEIP